MLTLEHPTSQTHIRMSREKRAAQFAPFAALTGHEAAMHETARLTCERKELDEHALALLDHRWRCVREQIDARPPVTLTYFAADKQKDGGEYLTVSGLLIAVDDTTGVLQLSDGTCVPLADIIAIDSPLFSLFSTPTE